MDEIYFLVRYTPFWAMPLLLIAIEFAYLAWIRKKKSWLYACLVSSVISIFSLIFYYWTGGPEKSVKALMDLVRFYSS